MQEEGDSGGNHPPDHNNRYMLQSNAHPDCSFTESIPTVVMPASRIDSVASGCATASAITDVIRFLSGGFVLHQFPDHLLLFGRVIEIPQHENVAAGGVKDYVTELEHALNQPLTDFDGSHCAELNTFIMFDEQSPAGVRTGFSDRVYGADHFQMDVADEGKDADATNQPDERNAKINRALLPPGIGGDHANTGQAND